MDHNYVIRHDIIDSGESRILKGASSITRVPTYFSPRCSPHPSFALHFFFLLSFSFHHFALKQPRYKRSSYVLGRALVPVVSSSARSMSCHSLLPLSAAGDWRITSQGQCCHHQLNTAITNPLTGVYLLLREGVKERGEKRWKVERNITQIQTISKPGVREKNANPLCFV